MMKRNKNQQAYSRVLNQSRELKKRHRSLIASTLFQVRPSGSDRETTKIAFDFSKPEPQFSPLPLKVELKNRRKKSRSPNFTNPVVAVWISNFIEDKSFEIFETQGSWPKEYTLDLPYLNPPMVKKESKVENRLRCRRSSTPNQFTHNFVFK